MVVRSDADNEGGFNTGSFLLADDAAQALLALEQSGGSVGLMLTDVSMPGMNGSELAGRVAEAWPDVYTVFMSGDTENTPLTLSVSHDQAHFISKPFTRAELLSKGRATLDRPRHVSTTGPPGQVGPPAS